MCAPRRCQPGLGLPGRPVGSLPAPGGRASRAGGAGEPVGIQGASVGSELDPERRDPDSEQGVGAGAAALLLARARDGAAPVTRRGRGRWMEEAGGARPEPGSGRRGARGAPPAQPPPRARSLRVVPGAGRAAGPRREGGQRGAAPVAAGGTGRRSGTAPGRRGPDGALVPRPVPRRPRAGEGSRTSGPRGRAARRFAGEGGRGARVCLPRCPQKST